MKRSSSRRTYKKRRTFRKSRSNRHRKTQRGGFGFGDQFKGMGLGNMNFDSPGASHSPSIHPGNTSMFGKVGKGLLAAGALGVGAIAAKKGYEMYKQRQARSALAAQAPGPGLSVVGKAMNLQNRDPPKQSSSKTSSKTSFNVLSNTNKKPNDR